MQHSTARRRPAQTAAAHHPAALALLGMTLRKHSSPPVAGLVQCATPVTAFTGSAATAGALQGRVRRARLHSVALLLPLFSNCSTSPHLQFGMLL